MAKVKAITDYYDLELKKFVIAGDEFEVADARAKVLSSKDNKAMQPLVEVVAKAAPKKSPAKKKVEDK